MPVCRSVRPVPLSLPAATVPRVLTIVAVSGYRSLRDVVVPLHGLDVVTGANGSGKSSLYRALRLLADCGAGQVIGSLAREGGLQSALWAGPETLGGTRREGHAVQGTVRKGPISLRLGFATDDGFGYLVDLGLPPPASIPGDPSAFDRDPVVKREVVFSGPLARPGSVLVERRGPLVRAREGRGWVELTRGIQTHESMLAELADPGRTPELLAVREQLRSWRFYDSFRTDRDAPARRPQVGTRTPVLDHDGADVAAALQTIHEGRRRPGARRGDRRRLRRREPERDGLGRTLRRRSSTTGDASTPGRSRAQRRDASLPSARRRPAHASPAAAHGPQRAGDKPAP